MRGNVAWESGDILVLIGPVYAVFDNTAEYLKKTQGIRVVRVMLDYGALKAAGE